MVGFRGNVGWGLGVELHTPPQKNTVLLNHGGEQDTRRVKTTVKKKSRK
jgi:hypothetical protein